MLKDEVISSVTEPTDWCSGIVVVPKANDAVRIYVNITHLNKVVNREVHPMASIDENLSKLANSKIFTKLDTKSGYWQIPLSEDSRKFTTFVTPFGRYQFNCLPFGINSASVPCHKSLVTWKVLFAIWTIFWFMLQIRTHTITTSDWSFNVFRMPVSHWMRSVNSRNHVWNFWAISSTAKEFMQTLWKWRPYSSFHVQPWWLNSSVS